MVDYDGLDNIAMFRDKESEGLVNGAKSPTNMSITLGSNKRGTFNTLRHG